MTTEEFIRRLGAIQRKMHEIAEDALHYDLTQHKLKSEGKPTDTPDRKQLKENLARRELQLKVEILRTTADMIETQLEDKDIPVEKIVVPDCMPMNL